MNRTLAGVGVLVLVAALGLSAAVSAAPSPSSDLKITKTAGASSVNVGSNLTYQIGVENLGPDPATGVTVTDNLPNSVDFVAATSSIGQCSAKGRKVTCVIGGLEAGPSALASSAAITLSVAVRKSGRIVNTASVSAAEHDPVKSNNKASVTVQALAAPKPRRATCRGLAANVVGTSRGELLTGTPARDVIAALGGSDTILARAGRDLVCAGRGSDVVNGGPGADRVFAGAGRDRVLGRDGPDVLKGQGGPDTLKGNRGLDRLFGGPGFDTCRGGPGFNVLRNCERR